MRKLFEKMFTNYVILSEAKNLKSITPHPVFSFFAHAQKRKQTSPARGEVKKAAFTLAETLITLGIIGIVAALVIPGVINNFKIKELESRFKKTDAAITKALYGALNELDADVGEYLNDTTTPDGPNGAVASARTAELNSVWEKQFPGAKRFISGNKWSIHKDFAKCTQFFSDNKSFCYAYTVGGLNGLLLPDGSFISMVVVRPVSGGGSKGTSIVVYFDTNGPYKGPNAYGYDYFRYESRTRSNTYCAPLGGASDYWIGCYYWAKLNQNPYDSRVSYWKSLYKPKSWWENVRNNSKK